MIEHEWQAPMLAAGRRSMNQGARGGHAVEGGITSPRIRKEWCPAES